MGKKGGGGNNTTCEILGERLEFEGCRCAVCTVWEPTTEENELTRNSSGNTRPQSSQLAEPLWTDPGPKSGIGVRELSPLKKQTKKRR